MNGNADDFDWDGENAPVVVRHQPGVAVYANPRGEIVIRQEDHYGDVENDPFVYINPAHVPAVALALLRTAGLVTSKPLKPQITAMLASTPAFDFKAAANVFAALDAELTEGEGGPLQQEVSAMMADHPEIDWPRASRAFNNGNKQEELAIGGAR